MSANGDASIATVISGSFRKHLNEIYSLKSFLQHQGINVLSPVGTRAVNPGEEFVVLDDDPVADHRILQDSVFAKIRRSTFLVVYNKDGYLGRAALLEIGYAVALGLQVLTVEPVEDPNIAPYTRLLSDALPGHSAN